MSLRVYCVENSLQSVLHVNEGKLQTQIDQFPAGSQIVLCVEAIGTLVELHRASGLSMSQRPI